MKGINGHPSDVASTIAKTHTTPSGGSVPLNTPEDKTAHTRGGYTSQLLPQLTQPLQTIKQEEENAGNPGPYWLTETDYESLYILRQQYTEHKEDKIT